MKNTVIPPLSTVLNSNNNTIPSTSLYKNSPPLPTKMSPQISVNNEYTIPQSPKPPIDVLSYKIPQAESKLPLNPSIEIMSQPFEITNYHGIISTSSLENEIMNFGYTPLSKIVVRSTDGEKRTQYIKAINRNGQKVFILIDVKGYTSARDDDIVVDEKNDANMIPYSLKMGAFNCSGKDVCGVAFECGTSVCVVSRNLEETTPSESTFTFSREGDVAIINVENRKSVLVYPIVRLSEIRVNPDLVLHNSDIVTRRLRNSLYVTLVENLAGTQRSISKLNHLFNKFNQARELYASKLNKTLTTLEEWNNVYLSNPPRTDIEKDKFKKLQNNLTIRNDGIGTLLKLMDVAADQKKEVDKINNNLSDILAIWDKEYENIDYAINS